MSLKTKKQFVDRVSYKMNKSITYVTSLYDIYGDISKLQFYLIYFKKLVDTGVSIVCFTDVVFDRFIPKVDNIKKVVLPLNEIDIYRSICEMPNIKFPERRNPSKDTIEYYALMVCKVYFMKLAYEMNLVETPYMAWIDAGSFKLYKDSENATRKLVQCRLKPGINKIIIPGSWNRGNVPFDCVSWRFLGTFFISPVSDIILKFWSYMNDVMTPLLERGLIVWEINYWALVELKYPILFYWYLGDHNDSLLNISEELLDNEMMLLIPTSYGDGIGNLMKGYISALSINKNAKFDLSPLDNKYGLIQSVMSDIHIYDKVRDSHFIQEKFNTCRLMVLKEEEGLQSNLVNEFKGNDYGGNSKLIRYFAKNCLIDWFYEPSLVNEVVRNRILGVISQIKFKDDIYERVNQLKSRIQHPSLAVSVRTWKAAHESNVKREYNPEVYKKAINEVLSSNPEIKTVVLSVDQDSSFLEYQMMFKSHPVLSLRHDETANMIEGSVISFLVMSSCNFLVCNRISTFSELIYWYSGCKQSVRALF